MLENIVGIPFPRFVVFYNGVAKLSERQTLKLSDAYEKSARQPELELFVIVYITPAVKSHNILLAQTSICGVVINRRSARYGSIFRLAYEDLFRVICRKI